MKSNQLRHFVRGFSYAYNGIRIAIREERNFRFHLCAALYAFWAAYLAELPGAETSIVALCVAAVLSLELVNSAVERAVDNPDASHWSTAGAAKDTAAGAVLIMALGTLIVAGCLFVPRRYILWNNFTKHPANILVAFVLLPLVFYKFIFRAENTIQKGEQPNDKTDS